MIRRWFYSVLFSIPCRIIGGPSPSGKDRTEFFREYNKYLKSWRWAFRRKLVLKRDGGKCRMCRKKAHTVHHLAYEHIGRERLKELATLCNYCHAGQHPR